MPIYEYQCDACGHRLEALQKISDKPLKKCPDCGKSQLRKLVSAAAFRLKGGGWYETDFKGDKAQRNLAKGDEAPAESGDKKKETAETPAADSAKPDSKTKETKPAESKAAEPKSEKPAKKKAAKKAAD